MATDYILRRIDPDLWARCKARSEAEGVPLRAVILKLLELYGAGDLHLVGAQRRTPR